jgi:hypothetical protein
MTEKKPYIPAPGEVLFATIDESFELTLEVDAPSEA